MREHTLCSFLAKAEPVSVWRDGLALQGCYIYISALTQPAVRHSLLLEGHLVCCIKKASTGCVCARVCVCVCAHACTATLTK